MAITDDLSAALASMNGAIQGLGNTQTQVDAALASLTAAYNTRISTFVQTVYVHSTTGLDTNDGTINAPVKTIGRALAMTAPGGICTAILRADYNIQEAIPVTNRRLLLVSDSATRWRISFGAYLSLLNATQYRNIHGFGLSRNAAVLVSGLELFMPSLSAVAGSGAAAFHGGSALFRQDDSTNAFISMNNCNVVMTTDPFGSMTSGSSNNPMDYFELSITLSGGASSLNGRRFYSPSDTAGTSVAALYWLKTNLTTV